MPRRILSRWIRLRIFTARKRSTFLGLRSIGTFSDRCWGPSVIGWLLLHSGAIFVQTAYIRNFCLTNTPLRLIYTGWALITTWWKVPLTWLMYDHSLGHKDINRLDFFSCNELTLRWPRLRWFDSGIVANSPRSCSRDRTVIYLNIEEILGKHAWSSFVFIARNLPHGRWYDAV